MNLFDVILCGSGVLIGCGSTLIVQAIISRKWNEPTPMTDYEDLSYEAWQSQIQADARRNRLAPSTDDADTTFPNIRRNPKHHKK